MLAVSRSATEALQAILDNLDLEPGECVRLKVVPEEKVGFVLDVERPGDQVVKHGEKKVLVVDSETAQQLDGVTLKYRATEEAAGFTLLRKKEREQTHN
jgi:Fe-S cluster assembly iron-binding protein IscA